MATNTAGPQPEESSEITSKLSQLEHIIEALEQTLVKHMDRICSVTRAKSSQPNPESEKDVEVHESSTELGRTLHIDIGRLEGLVSEMQDLTARVEL